MEVNEAMVDVELQAYWGWLARHAEAAPMARREAAARAYVEAGGVNGAEVEATFALRRGRPQVAVELFEAAFEETGNLRVRNHGLAVMSVFD